MVEASEKSSFENSVIRPLNGHSRGTVEDTELIDGLVFTSKTSGAGGPNKIEKAKVGLIQFCISPPKTDMDNQVIVSDYTQMDRVLREERAYILDIVKKIKKAGCNVLLIQKSILRDAVSDLALHFLAKMKILVVKEVEREDVEFVCKTLGCKPIASVDHFLPENLGSAELVEEVQTGSSKIVKPAARTPELPFFHAISPSTMQFGCGLAKPGAARNPILRGWCTL
ncbi:T-complex protein 1 subunit delta [Elysia marginata]|uniref:T-complex protein 1 subunit delta n=1 Tax=Elysia marginata TaxID=1093978 RepID=A0AAV4GEU1_9GAST|nr:T-complex protein 1 subunit delta [Elysia marginata]